MPIGPVSKNREKKEKKRSKRLISDEAYKIIY